MKFRNLAAGRLNSPVLESITELRSSFAKGIVAWLQLSTIATVNIYKQQG
jgi:hypothetical protein